MEPISCETPRIWSIADILRERIAIDVILLAENASANTTDLLLPLLEEFPPSSDVWYAALTCPYHDGIHDQDIPLVEAAKRNQSSLISSFMTLIPMSETRKKLLLDAPGRYGRTAVKHAVSNQQWHAASMLIRHGCSLGLNGDQYGIVRNICHAVGVEPQANILSKVDVKDYQLSLLVMTMDSLYGYDWATMSAPLTAREQNEVGLRPLKGMISEERSYFSPSSARDTTPRTVGCPWNSWALRPAHTETRQPSTSLAFSSGPSGCLDHRASDIGSWPTSAQSHDGHSPHTPLSPRAVSTPGGRHDYERTKNMQKLMGKWQIREAYTPETKHSTPSHTPSVTRLSSERG